MERRNKSILVPVTAAELENAYRWSRRYEREPGAHLRWLLRDVLAGRPIPPELDELASADETLAVPA